MTEPTTTASVIGSVASATVGIIMAVDTAWPWAAIGVGLTCVTLIWAAVLKFVFTEMENRMAKEFSKLHDALEEKFVTQKEFHATVQPMMRRRENR